MKEENERNEKAKVCALVDGAVVLSQCVFNDSIKTKIRAQEGIYVVKAVRFYELSSRDRCQKSGVVRLAGGRRNCR